MRLKVALAETAISGLAPHTIVNVDFEEQLRTTTAQATPSPLHSNSRKDGECPITIEPVMPRSWYLANDSLYRLPAL